MRETPLPIESLRLLRPGTVLQNSNGQIFPILLFTGITESKEREFVFDNLHRNYV